jgi:hypothetical protein
VKTTISIDINADEALDLVHEKLGNDELLGRIELGSICDYVGVKDFIGYYSIEEVLSYINDDYIEEEYLKRTSLGKALNE